MAKVNREFWKFKNFESKFKGEKQKHLRLTDSMLLSDAYYNLSSNAKVVYQEMKRKYNGSNENDISLTYREAKEHLRMDSRAFTKAIDNLLECGFIKLIHQGWHKADPTIYGFSSEWQKYGTSEMNASKRVKRSSNSRQVQASREALERRRANDKKVVKLPSAKLH